MIREGRVNEDYLEETSRALWWEERVEGKAEMRWAETLPKEQKTE